MATVTGPQKGIIQVTGEATQIQRVRDSLTNVYAYGASLRGGLLDPTPHISLASSLS